MAHTFWQRQMNRVKYGCYLLNVNRVLAPLGRVPLILCFHRVRKPQGLLDQCVGSLSREQFVWVLDYVRSLGYAFADLETVVGEVRQAKLRRVAAVTFDDGFEDLYHAAFPILRERAIPFSLFLVTSVLDSGRLLWLHKLYTLAERLTEAQQRETLAGFTEGSEPFALRAALRRVYRHEKPERVLELIDAFQRRANFDAQQEAELARSLYLTGEQLRQMQMHGLTIESHGVDHWSLESLDEGRTRREIGDSFDRIEAQFGRRPRFYAPPFGFRNAFLAAAVGEAGGMGACTTDTRAIRRHEDVMDLPRVYRHNDCPQLFAWHLSGLFLQGLGSRLLSR